VGRGLRIGHSVEALSGLLFPSNAATEAEGTVAFHFTGAALLPAFPATYIWRARHDYQASYYTTFFWGPSGSFTGAGYYGPHPYPDGGPGGLTHKWEISVEGDDYVTGDGGVSTVVDPYGVFRDQAFIATATGSVLHTKFYFDLSDTSKSLTRSTNPTYADGFAAVTDPALTFGDAPWAPGNETLNGVLRGLQVYSGELSIEHILALRQLTSSSAVRAYCAANGITSLHYVNLNPTPDDISDKSGNGNHPAWVNANRPTLWTP
jgi:hypothetical protein